MKLKHLIYLSMTGGLLISSNGFCRADENSAYLEALIKKEGPLAAAALCYLPATNAVVTAALAEGKNCKLIEAPQFQTLPKDRQQAVVANVAQFMQGLAPKEREHFKESLGQWLAVSKQWEDLVKLSGEEFAFNGLFELEETRPVFSSAAQTRGYKNLDDVPSGLIGNALSAGEQSLIKGEAFTILSGLSPEDIEPFFSRLSDEAEMFKKAQTR